MSMNPEVEVNKEGIYFVDMDYDYRSMRDDCFEAHGKNEEECWEMADFPPTKEGILAMVKALEIGEKEWFGDDLIFNFESVKELVRILTTEQVPPNSENKISLAKLANEYDGSDNFSIDGWEVYDINHFQTTLRICAFKTFDITDDKIVQVKD